MSQYNAANLFNDDPADNIFVTERYWAVIPQLREMIEIQYLCDETEGKYPQDWSRKEVRQLIQGLTHLETVVISKETSTLNSKTHMFQETVDFWNGIRPLEYDMDEVENSELSLC